jgi:hypothetical protein
LVFEEEKGENGIGFGSCCSGLDCYMSKTTFAERFEKAGKFYDTGYHHHKATFKGLGEFYRSYGGIEKDYAGQLLKLSEGGTFASTQLPQPSSISPKNSPTFKPAFDRFVAILKGLASCILTMERG